MDFFEGRIKVINNWSDTMKKSMSCFSEHSIKTKELSLIVRLKFSSLPPFIITIPKFKGRSFHVQNKLLCICECGYF